MSIHTSQVLQAALTAHLLDEDLIEDADVVGDWVLVAAIPNLDGDTRYITAYPADSLPTHVAAGLLLVGADHVRYSSDT